ncbi:ImmA/IrrE family metallo-endopeptidase [Arthrobacter sp. FW306-2-2C-D06B]|uniref:ImmA/IrrE family metallo-endopeptidase n=1 Tax=Arthrobacter sp. FW306-2-2C-D06B TaxID=2879618 RepID=UPI003FA4A3D5|nr:ImmA/IrrE family metallo-endopeptidase [Arthrobacter sp. FW306-2-2C-D06B]
MGVRVRTAVTPAGWWGAYDHQRRLITLRPGLGPIQSACTLMHELGHAYYGHIGVTGKQETLANRWAAFRLVDFDRMIAAAAAEQSTAGVAASLGVLPSVLETYLQTLTRAQLDHVRAVAVGRAA